MKTTLFAAALAAGLATLPAAAQQHGTMHHGGAAPARPAAGPAAMPCGAGPGQKPCPAGAGGPAMMQHGAMPMQPGAAAPAGAGDTGPSSAAFAAANAKMHRDMDFPFTGDADVDFVKGMIAHHQGAIDMAKVVIGFGKDAEVKKLAEEIVKAQEGEIAWMKEWLAKKGK